MKITRSSDWRDAIPFEVPVLASEAQPGEPTRCAICGTTSEPRERYELWAVKHQHPNNHSGFVRFYCLEHRPEPPRRVDPAQEIATRAKASRAPSARRSPTTRAQPVDERPPVLCPDCFVEVPATRICGMCGQKVV